MNSSVELFGAAVYIALAVGLAVAMLALVRIVTWWLGTGIPKRGKYDTYECGVPQLGSSRQRLPIKFYVVALLFVLFDIEIAFLLPYAVAYKRLGMEGLGAVLVFVGVLGLGLLYVLKRRALETKDE
jgi:NADH-quinone oxidoreductase subunit A